MTSTNNPLTELRVKKYIPYFIVGKLTIFAGFLIYMMQGQKMNSTFFLIAASAFFYLMACLWRDLKSNPTFYFN